MKHTSITIFLFLNLCITFPVGLLGALDTTTTNTSAAKALMDATNTTTTEKAEEQDLEQTIGEISISGNQYVSAAAIRNRLPFKIGEKFDAEKTSLAIRLIYNIGYFNQITIEKSQIDTDRIALFITVKEKKLLEKVIYHGNKNLKKTDINDKLKLDKLKTISEEDALAIDLRIQDLYKDENYHLTKVNHQIIIDAENPDKAKLEIFVEEGPASVITRVVFKGNKSIPDRKLAASIFTREQWLFGFMSDAGKFDEKHLEMDKHRIEYAYRDQGLVQQAVRKVRGRFPELLIFTDVCLCGYTDHGHCGPLNEDGSVDNDTANEILSKTAVSHAAAGADGVAPSAMMDGQVLAIRKALSESKFDDTLIMSYSTKFASAMYGPFREAAGSTPAQGDRRTYQAPYNDIRQALRESRMDEDEGADILMVKPSLFYLDVIAKVREMTHLPLAAYNVSGEYSMLIASAEQGWGNLKAMVRESITAVARAGADIIISYWANRYREVLGGRGWGEKGNG